MNLEKSICGLFFNNESHQNHFNISIVPKEPQLKIKTFGKHCQLPHWSKLWCSNAVRKLDAPGELRTVGMLVLVLVVVVVVVVIMMMDEIMYSWWWYPDCW